MIQLLVGLGNPGLEYAETRHNAGNWFVQQLAQHLKITLQMDKNHRGLLGKTVVNGRPIWLLLPQTYMNLSGYSVASLANFFKIAPSSILVVHDELDISTGQAKLKFGGSHAGHNGLKDIHQRIGSPDYWRLRIGIDHPGDRNAVADWVLRKPPLDEKIAIEQTIDRCIRVIQDIFDGKMDKAIMHIHTHKPIRETSSHLLNK